jgi:hypothetical protein
MLFCPKCKYEYEDDIKTCPDCGSELVSELINTDEQFNNQVYYDENKEYLEQLKSFLKENGIENVSVNFEEDRNLYSLCTDTSSKFKATTLLNILFKEELEKEATENNEFSDLSATEYSSDKKANKKQGKYKNALAKYNDYFGTGIVNTIIGIIGDLAFIFDFYNIRSNGSIITNVGMIAIFSFFLGSGIYYFVKSQKFKPEIAKEGKITDDIMNFIIQNYNKTYIDDKINEKIQNIDENTIYFVRTAFITNEIKNRFNEIDDEYLDNLVEQLYEKIFEE